MLLHIFEQISFGHYNFIANSPNIQQIDPPFLFLEEELYFLELC